MGAHQGKVALITGGAKGIGRAVAEKLAAQGADIAVVYQSDAATAQATAADIRAMGVRAVAIQADMGDIDAVAAAFAEVTETLGRLDILVLGAGFFIFKPIVQMSAEDYDRLFAVNTRGTFFALQQAAKLMADDGRVIFVSAASTGGTGAPGNAAATASKLASEFFVKVLAKEVAARRITANIVSPGPTRTDNFDKLPETVRANAANLSPFGRVGEVDDVASVIAFLASEEARWITGQNLRATGGG
jgi:3-oxoacyl-[acyl-carrier protein] reductase